LNVHIKENAKNFHRFDAAWTPTVVVSNSDGKERYRLEGYLSKDEFEMFLEMGLGRVAFMKKDFANAEKHYANVLDQHPDSHFAPEAVYWRGVSRAILYDMTGTDMEAPEERTLDFTQVPHIAGVPRYMYRSCLQAAWSMATGLARRDSVAVLDGEMRVCFYAGVFRERWRSRYRPSTGMLPDPRVERQPETRA